MLLSNLRTGIIGDQEMSGKYRNSIESRKLYIRRNNSKGDSIETRYIAICFPEVI